MQQWYGLSDPGMEEALYDIESVRRFAGIELGQEEIPDETTILNFRHLLEKHQLTEKLLEEVNGYLSEKRLLLRQGTIVDATLIGALVLDQEQGQETRRGDEFDQEGQQLPLRHEGAHGELDSQSGLVHTVKVTTASVHDKQEMEALLHGEE